MMTCALCGAVVEFSEDPRLAFSPYSEVQIGLSFDYPGIAKLAGDAWAHAACTTRANIQRATAST